MKKKILSLAIAICMVAAMLPSVVLTAGAEDTTYNKLVYRFTSYPYGFSDKDTETWYDSTENDGITYKESYGMLSYRGSNNITKTNARTDARLEITFGTKATEGENTTYQNVDNAWIAFDINVPVTDTYNVIYTGASISGDGAYGEAYILDGKEELSDIKEAKDKGTKLKRRYVKSGTVNKYEDSPISYVSNSLCTAGNDTSEGGIYLEKGTCTLLLTCLTTSDGALTGTAMAANKIYPVSLTLESVDKPENATLSTPYTGVVSLSKDIVSLQDTEPVIATAVAAYIPDGTVAYTSTTAITKITDLTFMSSNESVATVENGSIVPKSEGETVISARKTGDTSSPNGIIGAKLTVTAPEADEDFTNEFTGVNGYTIDVTKAFTEAKTTANFYSAVVGGTVEMNETTLLKADDDVALGTQYSYTAPEKEGHIFRYWAKALTNEKLIVTRNATVKFMPTVETTNLVAVYEPEAGATVTGESFYNANGQLLTDVNITDDGKMPSLPSMTGYGTASAWVQYGTDEEFAAGADAPAENLMFVAKYGEPTETYAIDVVGGTKSGDGKYTYGQKVSCTATVPTGKVFKCWTKTVGNVTRIISLDEEYTFNAWESCTITAVFADEEPVFTGNKFSIILSEMTGKVGDNTAYMAEFVGLEKAVEKGIQFGTKRVAMTTDATQFTAVNDINGVVDANVKGYAILSDGTVIYDK